MNMKPAKTLLRASLLACLLGPLAAWAGVTDHYWHDTASRVLPDDAPKPANYRSLSLDSVQMLRYLQDAERADQPAVVSIPLPEGGFSDFTVVDSGTLSPGLQARLKNEFDFDVLSLKGNDAEGRRIRLDVSPIGFQAMVFDPDGIWLIRPEAFAIGNSQYLSFRRSELSLPADFQYIEDPIDDIVDHVADAERPTAPMTETGTTIRNYRAAVAANHQYIAAVGGGTAAGGQAAVVVAINRVNEVYNYELSVQLTLIPNNIDLMFPNAAGDPFGANNSGILNSITGEINTRIGVNNYDIGHAFTTGSGGVAGLGVVCGSSKGRGTTGLGNPIGDGFYIDFVAHEMGHQFRGNHTFNSTEASNCGPNRNASTAYEPGSGTSIMGYAGVCASGENLENHSIPYFHAISLQEINTFINGTGGSCPTTSPNPNQMPVIDPASLPAERSIPVSTPLLLEASASDADAGDIISYSWEGWDKGAGATLPQGDVGTNALFRSWPPKLSGARPFPSMSTVLGGPVLKGEILPTTTRDVKFRLTVRDRDDVNAPNRHGLGRTQSADVILHAVTTAGPFKVNTPLAGDTWYGGASSPVTWNVANTSAAPVSCASVDVLVSLDGGTTFDHVAATGIPNSGSGNVTAPIVANPVSNARVMVKCSNNVFFNVSPANFTIMPGGNLYHVSGTVSGLNGTGLVLKLNGGNPQSISADGPFAFDTPLLDGSAYAVTVSSQPINPFQECTVANGSGTIPDADVTNVLVTCVDLDTFSIGGTISGLTNNGLKLSLNNGAQVLTVPGGTTAFEFDFGVLDHTAYTVSILTQPAGQTCSISANSGTVNGADIDSVSLTCTDNPIEPHMVGGRVYGLTSPGLVLQLNGGLTIVVNNNGPYNFYPGVDSGTHYEVTVQTQPPGQTCTIANASGTMGFENVTNVDVTCAALTPELFSDGFEDNVP